MFPARQSGLTLVGVDASHELLRQRSTATVMKHLILFDAKQRLDSSVLLL
jgi:hypothetical protein